ncbi:hypothetical protein PROPEN_00437 [Proteus penneri ATCC 35198]|nr:hypothetical protein PROPEN_00437 [Proteus penneri ATCC 35198]
MQKNELNDFIDFIYEDNKVSNVELQFIRDVADEKIEALFKRLGENNNLSAFQKINGCISSINAKRLF